MKMKRVLTRFLAIGSVALLMLASCKKNDAIVTANSGKAGVLSSSTASVTLVKANDTIATPVVTFTFTMASYGFKASITNTLEIDTTGDNWANPVSITLGSGLLSYSYNTADLNTLALKLNIKPKAQGTILVRIAHTISTTITPVYSNVISVSVTPYSTVIPAAYLYVVGAYQGWSTATPDSLVALNGSTTYTGIINFTAGNNQFLILPAKSFTNKYATTDVSTPSATVGYNANNNLVAPTAAGNYLITLNLTANTITFTAVDYYSVIGNSTPGTAWSTDTPLKFVNDGKNNWVINGIPMIVGAFKVRQDDQWTNSWGTIATPDGMTLTDSNGGNIPINTAGNYNFTFNMAPTAYGSPAVATTTYTLTQ